MAEALEAQDSSYIFTFDNGTTIKRRQLAQLIINTIGKEKKHTGRISKEIGMNYQSVFSVIRTLVTADIIISEKQSKHTVYKLPIPCGLDDVFKHKNALDNVKIKSVTKHKAEDFPNISFGGKSGYENYSPNISNPIYEGGFE
tara:strand:- start:728 stop:1156 length:429 start_codon:yes stop_codon:yes gene_type:complete